MAVDPTVENIKFQWSRPESRTSPLNSFGTLNGGYETMTEAWPTLEHVFAVNPAPGSQAQHTPQHSSPPPIC